MKTVCVVTGSRAEYGLLRPLLKKIKEDPELTLQIIVTGAHLSPLYGNTKEEIVRDEYEISQEIEILLSSDTPIGNCKAMGLAMIGLSEAFERLKPDLVVLLGDRYEIFSAASAALLCKIPIAHIHGGELTYGAFDDSLRHAITKMSSLHFTSTECYRRRVIQLGENPATVFRVGSLGVENSKMEALYTKEEIKEGYGLAFSSPTALITMHPSTLEKNPVWGQISPILDALDSFKDLYLIFTKANADTGGMEINQRIEEFVDKNKSRACLFASLGSRAYLSIMKQCSIIIGNSSSGILEAPSLNVPSVTIGDRQAGRVRANSVLSCINTAQEIKRTIELALYKNWTEEEFHNPYEEANTSEKIVEHIKKALKQGINTKKIFFDIE